jgi:hypothetical protein
VPIETLWITGTGDQFEVHICEGRRAVTVVNLIPLVRPYGSRRAKARSWVVRTSDGTEGDRERALDGGDPPVVMVQVSGGPPADA